MDNVWNISIHALREEGDLGAQVRRVVERAFLSTPSARRATRDHVQRPLTTEISIHALREEGDLMSVSFLRSGDYFYPRPPRGGRRPVCGKVIATHKISIHALREEGDIGRHGLFVAIQGFLSTPSARRATCQKLRQR